MNANKISKTSILTSTFVVATLLFSTFAHAQLEAASQVTEWKVIKKSSVLDSTTYNCDEGSGGTATTYTDILVAENIKPVLQVSCQRHLIGGDTMTIFLNGFDPRSRGHIGWTSSAFAKGQGYRKKLGRGECERVLAQFENASVNQPMYIKVDQRGKTFSF